MAERSSNVAPRGWLVGKQNQIKEAHRNCEQSFKSGLQHALEAGRLLLEVKDSGKVPHGQWAKWVKEELQFAPRRAQLYMQVASAVAVLPEHAQRVALLSLRQTLSLARKIKDMDASSKGKVLGLLAEGKADTVEDALSVVCPERLPQRADTPVAETTWQRSVEVINPEPEPTERLPVKVVYPKFKPPPTFDYEVPLVEVAPGQVEACLLPVVPAAPRGGQAKDVAITPGAPEPERSVVQQARDFALAFRRRFDSHREILLETPGLREMLLAADQVAAMVE
jgi:hypothetical protein